MITPDEIANKQFTVARLGKGYAQDEVDDFLDALQVDYTAALKQVQDAQQRLSVALRAQGEAATTQLPPMPALPSMPAPPAPPGGPSVESIAMLLQTAQQTAEQIIAKANGDAAGIVAAARVDADKMRGQAAIDSDKIKNDATAAAQAEVSQANARLADITQQIEGLKAVHADTAAKLRGALDTLGAAA